MTVSFWNIFSIFFKIGAILLGGGYVILPIVTNEFINKRKLISKDELQNYFALSQSLPGIIAANISMFIGYNLRGKYGAILAMVGVITAPFFIIVVLASLLDLILQNQYLQAALWGIEIAVIALIILTIREFLQNCKKDLFFFIIFALSLILLLLFNFSPIQTILIMTPFGIIYKLIFKRRERK
jgi:chromate transporter